MLLLVEFTCKEQIPHLSVSCWGILFERQVSHQSCLVLLQGLGKSRTQLPALGDGLPFLKYFCHRGSMSFTLSINSPRTLSYRVPTPFLQKTWEGCVKMGRVLNRETEDTHRSESKIDVPP